MIAIPYPKQINKRPQHNHNWQLRASRTIKQIKDVVAIHYTNNYRLAPKLRITYSLI